VQSSLVGDRRSYQLDPANAREGLREVLLDVEEGADIVMVKPAMSYLDVLAEAAAVSPVPVWAYQVSGEYAMIEAASANGWIDRDRAVLEKDCPVDLGFNAPTLRLYDEAGVLTPCSQAGNA